MQVSQKQKTFSPCFLLHFWHLERNFKRLEKKDDPHKFCISEITDYENVVR